MRRGFWILAIVVASMFVAVGCGKFGSTETPAGDVPDTSGNTTSKISDEPFDKDEAERAGCGEIEEPENAGREHVEGEVDYEENPPTSGDHNPQPLAWGVYDEDQPAENFVHNMEHGHVVVTYKGLSGKEYKQLRKHVKRDKYHIVLLPRKGNPEDGVYYLAWDAKLHCEKPSAPALQKIVSDYRDQGPELFTRDEEKQADDDEE